MNINTHTNRRAWYISTTAHIFFILTLSSNISAIEFQSPDYYVAQNTPFELSVRDFDGDGILDIAATRAGVWPNGTGFVSIYFGIGDGTFQEPDNYTAGIISIGIACGDINEDGSPDIVVVNRRPSGGNSYLTVLLNKNDGTGEFVYGSPISSGSQPMLAAIADLNNDTHLDIAVGVHGNDAVQVLLGNGDGTFFEPTPWISAGNGVLGVRVVDVNGDSNLDILTSNWWSYNVSVLLGNGDGTFNEKVPRPAIGRRSWDLDTGDINEDGFLDIIAPNSLDRTMSVLLGNGDGTYQSQIVYPLSFGSSGVTVTDLDIDGHLDLLMGDCSAGVNFFKGNGDGSFQLPPTVFASHACSVTKVADLNNDGYSDLVATERADDQIVVFIQKPPNQPPTAVAGDDQSIRLGDTVYLNGSDSHDDYTPTAELLYSWSFTSYPGPVAPALANGDTATPTFVANLEGSYELELIVIDEEALTGTDYAVVGSDNLAPTSVASVDFDLLIVGDTATLDGTASFDPEDDPLSYSWSLTAAPAGNTAALVDDDQAQATLTPDAEGEYMVTLVVSDFLGPGESDALEVVATSMEGYVEIMIVCASDQIAALERDQITTSGHKRALLNYLQRAMASFQKDRIHNTIHMLDKAIVRVDGCTLRGEADGFERYTYEQKEEINAIKAAIQNAFTTGDYRSGCEYTMQLFELIRNEHWNSDHAMNRHAHDWVIDCEVQTEIYSCLSEALALLRD